MVLVSELGLNDVEISTNDLREILVALSRIFDFFSTLKTIKEEQGFPDEKSEKFRECSYKSSLILEVLLEKPDEFLDDSKHIYYEMIRKTSEALSVMADRSSEWLKSQGLLNEDGTVREKDSVDPSIEFTPEMTFLKTNFDKAHTLMHSVTRAINHGDVKTSIKEARKVLYLLEKSVAISDN